MKIGILKETAPGETRVALTPDVTKKYRKLGLEVLLESGAGSTAGMSDAEFTEAGAQLVSRDVAAGADIVLKVVPPNENEVAKLKKGALLVCLLEPYRN
ncbi:MAG TPA: NAD(P)(+) transhydrogenase (Re/Si-specific) subunit alpha, partial [Bdellovibrionota bacterium]|nr:NAD(P)(+) transhydrogenase (Re/Si-specific) subunit alpha [Bdellovibrionota bacterium]